MAGGHGVGRLLFCCLGAGWTAAVAATDRSDPAFWFLTPDEIQGSMGYSRAVDGAYPGIEDSTDGNMVTFIPDGKQWFAMIKEELDKSSAGDRVYVTGWSFSSKIDLVNDTWYDCLTETALRDLCTRGELCDIDIGLTEGQVATGKDASHPCCTNPRDEACQTTEGVMARATDRGVNIHIMSWENPFPGTNGASYLWATQEDMNDLFLGDDGVESVMLIENRVATVTGSVHQKALAFIRDGMPPVAFVGGFDLGRCRYDTTDAITGARRLSIIENCYGWLDQGVKIVGPAAADVANTIVQRWNWPEDLNSPNNKVNSAKWDARRNMDLPTADSGVPVNGSQSVQILRTYDCSYGAPFAPNGEFTILDAAVKAIKKAERYIYIEDQYGFWVKDIRDALLAAVNRGVSVVVMVNKYGAGLNFFCAGNGYYAWDDIQNAGGYIFEYNKADYGDFVHSKTWIVDDCWLMTGSANLNQRSMTSDPELNVAVVDDTCDAFTGDVHVENIVKSARCSMWSASASVEGQSIADICGMNDRTQAQMKTLVETIFGTTNSPVADKLRGLETYEDDNIFDWAKIYYSAIACAATDPDGRCDAGINNSPINTIVIIIAAAVVVVGLLGCCAVCYFARVTIAAVLCCWCIKKDQCS